MSKTTIPTEEVAKSMLEAWANQPVIRIERFTTGNHHYVYDAILADRSPVVIRMAIPSEKSAMIGAFEWNTTLRELGIPVAKLLFSNLDFTFPYLILDRLKGKDLGFTIDQMADEDLKTLATQLMGYQKTVAKLPYGNRFGYSISHDTANGHSWKAVLNQIIDRSEKRITDTGFVNTSNVTKVRNLFEHCDSKLSLSHPTPFLHDITTKNVIIHNGKLSGIVDVDDLCYGDPLFHIGLTQMAVLSQNSNVKYIQFLLSAFGDFSSDLLRLYTAICCLDFLSELGQPFNGNIIAATVDRKAYLEMILMDLLDYP